MEQVTWVGADGQSLVLTDYAAGTAILTARRGWTAPPQQLFHERLPDSAGARIVGAVIRERTVAFTLVLRTQGHEDALRAEATVAAVLSQDGYLESVANGVTRRLDLAYKGGLEGDTAGRRGGPAGWPVLVPQYETRGYPYWYDPAPQEAVLNLAVAPAGAMFPITFPVFFPQTGIATSAVVDAGPVGGPWRATVPGPFTRLEWLRLGPGNATETLDLSTSVPAGYQVRLSTALGERRATLEAPAGSTNVTYQLSADSTFWQLLPGQNRIVLRVTGGNGATEGVCQWTTYYLAPGA